MKKIYIREKEIVDYIETLSKKKVKEINCIKRGDFTAVFRCYFYDDYRAKNSVIVKLCKEPLDIEQNIYSMMNNFKIKLSAQLYAVRQFKEYKLLILEDINGCSFEINKINAMTILVEIIKFHEYFANVVSSKTIDLSSERNIISIKEIIQNKLLMISQVNPIYAPMIDSILYNIDILISANAVCRQTLVHGDLYFDNVLYKDRYYVIDWGFAHVGLEYVDIATLLEKNSYKNGSLNLTMNEKIEIYCEAYKLAKGFELNENQAIHNLIYGSIMCKIDFLNWILYRVKNNYWVGNYSQKIESLLEDLYKCTIYYKDLLKHEK